MRMTMLLTLCFLMAGVSLTGCTAAKPAAPEKPLPVPNENHRKLDPLVGKWTTTTKMWSQPGKPPLETTGTCERSWILNGHYVQEVYRSKMGPQEFEGHGTIAFNSIRGCYEFTWVDCMSSGIFTGTGAFDAKTGAFVLENRGDCASAGEEVEVRMTHTWTNPDESVLTFTDANGAKSMEITFKRVK